MQHVEPTGPTTTIGLAFGKIKEITSNHRVLASGYPHGGPQQIGAASGEEPQRVLTSATRGTANELWDPGPDMANPKHSTPQDTPPPGNAISAQPHAPHQLMPDELGRGDRADTAYIVDNDLDATARPKMPQTATTPPTLASPPGRHPLFLTPMPQRVPCQEEEQSGPHTQRHSHNVGPRVCKRDTVLTTIHDPSLDTQDSLRLG